MFFSLGAAVILSHTVAETRLIVLAGYFVRLRSFVPGLMNS